MTNLGAATISAAFLVRNPPMERLAPLVDYLRPVMAEFVIVDTGSSPETIEKMAAWPQTKVIQQPWEDDFSKARNAGLVQCAGTWTFVIDPDELPSFDLMKLLEQLGDPDQHVPAPVLGFLIWTKNYWDGALGPEMDYHWHCRLFRTGHGRFYRPVHELVALDGCVESVTRNTPTLPRARRSAYLIHSKGRNEMAKADVLYERLGEQSR